MISLQEQQIKEVSFEKEIWIKSEGSNGIGTKNSPYLAVDGDFDPFVKMFGNNIKVNLFPGTYHTQGFQTPKTFSLSGDDADNTILKLKDSCRNNRSFPHLKMICDYNIWPYHFSIQDITLDGNWDGQEAYYNNGNFKIEPLVVQAIQGSAKRIKVINFGCNAEKYGTEGFECFPLALQTFSNGEPFQYYSNLNYLKNAEPRTYLEIIDCEVSKPHFLHGGYCTAIFVLTDYIGKGNRQPQSVRSTVSASVRNNLVEVPGGIAYGVASADAVVFDGNIAINTKAGFNFDTEIATRIKMTSNQFINCSQGIHFASYYGSEDCLFEKNLFVLSEPFFNPVTKVYEDSYCISAEKCKNSLAVQNHLMIPSGIKASTITGVQQENNTVQMMSDRNIIADAAEISLLSSRIEELRAEDSKAKALISSLSKEKETFFKKLQEAEARNQSTKQLIEDFKKSQNVLLDLILDK